MSEEWIERFGIPNQVRGPRITLDHCTLILTNGRLNCWFLSGLRTYALTIPPLRILFLDGISVSKVGGRVLDSWKS